MQGQQHLATLTGAIMIALGKEYAGMFVNDDKLSDELQSASRTTGEKVWRMPLDKAFDKMMDSKNADMKNTGSRWGGSASAAAFLQRFVQKDTPWCHLDIAGTAMDGTRNDINQSWGAGWGIRLLDRFVAEHGGAQHLPRACGRHEDKQRFRCGHQNVRRLLQHRLPFPRRRIPRANGGTNRRQLQPFGFGQRANLP